jgi:hypothetical protein
MKQFTNRDEEKNFQEIDVDDISIICTYPLPMAQEALILLRRLTYLKLHALNTASDLQIHVLSDSSTTRDVVSRLMDISDVSPASLFLEKYPFGSVKYHDTNKESEYGEEVKTSKKKKSK